MIEWAKLLLVDVLVPLAWPAVAMGAIVIFRKTLREAVGRVTSAKAGPMELKLQLPQLPREAAIITENLEPPPYSPSPPPPPPSKP